MYIKLWSIVISTVLSQGPSNVWYPLPNGFDQRKPDSILDLVQRSTQLKNSLPFDSVYVFGDSACDTGNLFKLNNFQDPDPSVYWRGRVSNGPMWPDYLAAQYNLNPRNFAYGGAVVSNYNYVNLPGIPDFSDQIANYRLNRFSGGRRPLALIEFVGNDLLNKTITSTKVAADFELMLQYLVDLGEIKDFLIILSSIEDYAAAGYNEAISDMVDSFRIRVQPDNVKIATLPILELNRRMALVPPPTAEPGKWAPIDNSCYNQYTKTLCKDPQNHFRFDLYHPSTVPNHNLARYIAETIRDYWV